MFSAFSPANVLYKLSLGGKLLESGYFSDSKVVCKDREWKTHRTILCSRSDWFRAALDGNFAEAKSGVVKFEEMKPRQIQWVLDWIYTGELSDNMETRVKDKPTPFRLRNVIELWSVADFLNLESLRKESERRMKRRVQDLIVSIRDVASFLSQPSGRYWPADNPLLRDCVWDVSAGLGLAYNLPGCPQSFVDSILKVAMDPNFTTLCYEEEENLNTYQTDWTTALWQDLTWGLMKNMRKDHRPPAARRRAKK